MDLSLEFEENKIKYKQPKQSKVKPSATKRVKRKIKGQKDIRIALQSNKNELISYTENFNKVCKESGIDVDSEQLQLAIALSKSLGETDDSTQTNDTGTFKPMTAQGKLRKINSTLQEYGFKVPEKVNALTNKKRRGRKKYSKLLQIGNEEKQQIIADKFSQILFCYNDSKCEVETQMLSISETSLFDISTNQPYEYLRNDAVFYVKGLIEFSDSKVGNLLKDWSKIPGRPTSPVCYKSVTIPFTKTLYSQYELDIILSGNMSIVKDIVKKKQNLMNVGSEQIKTNEQQRRSIDKQLDNHKDNAIDVLSLTNFISRSQSPDLFDDDISYMEQNNDKRKDLQQESQQSTQSDKTELLSQPSSQSSYNYTRKKSNDFMDLTECVNIPSVIDFHLESVNNYMKAVDIDSKGTEVNPLSQNSDGYHSARRKSNDFMDITECVGPRKSPDPKLSIIEENIDLSQGSNGSIEHQQQEIESMDLTQSDSNDSTLPYVQIGRKDTDNDSLVINETNNTQLSSVYNTNKSPVNEVADVENRVNLIMHDKENTLKTRLSTSFFDDYIHYGIECSRDYTENDMIATSSSKLLDETIPITKQEKENNVNFSPNSLDDAETNCLSKKGDLSIVYDEVFEKNDNSTPKKSVSKNDLESNEEITQKSQKSISNTSLNHDSDIVFELSDEELDYSLHMSKINKESNSIESDSVQNVNFLVNNFDFDSISLMDANMSLKRTTNNKVNGSLNRSISDYSLPIVDVKGRKGNINISKSQGTTPIKKFPNETVVSVETPKQNDYLIKTTNVTPMLDYESLDTPKINEELEKYGLKPFKRKRAIQLLHHIYNQTHPIIEENQVTGELTSPSKRFKPTEIATPTCSKAKSPRKLVESSKENVLCDMGNLFEVTNELPDIRNIQCRPDDWVFQKREKAKVKTCRLPLHIAFHNYVSCRRGLREAILRYEPVNIDVIHKELVSYGYRYDPKDLLKFMDKNCITVKTTENNRKAYKRH